MVRTYRRCCYECIPLFECRRLSTKSACYVWKEYLKKCVLSQRSHLLIWSCFSYCDVYYHRTQALKRTSLWQWCTHISFIGNCIIWNVVIIINVWLKCMVFCHAYKHLWYPKTHSFVRSYSINGWKMLSRPFLCYPKGEDKTYINRCPTSLAQLTNVKQLCSCNIPKNEE